MPNAPVLNDREIERRLEALPGWTRQGDAITCAFHFDTFPAGIAFVARVAEVAETQQHHPDIDIRYTTVTLTLRTHDSGGITDKDLAFAETTGKVRG